MSGYQSYRPHYESYRDERRDPRIRHVDTDRRDSINNTDQSRTPAIAAKKEMSNRPSNNVNLNENQSRLRDIRDEQNSRDIKLETPTTTPIMKIPTTRSIVETPDKTSTSRKLIIGEDISDPFTCNLTDDNGKRCIQDFSGVT